MSSLVEDTVDAPNVNADPGAPANGQNTANGDEQAAVGLSGVPSVPGIPKFRYGKEELLKLRDVPLSQRKPDFLDVNEVSPTIWDPTRWNGDGKKADATAENGGRNMDLLDHRRRPGDPRERIRKENDGIVLSPQRRSFNSGCFVPVRVPRVSRPNSPLGKSEPNHGGSVGGRDMPSNTRRIGSGRILRDSWDFADKAENNENDYNFRSQHRNVEGSDNRRSFSRDYDVGKDKERRGGGRFGDRRRMDNREEEPEWFSSGPISQNDTIELRGFEDSDRIVRKTQSKKIRDQSRAILYHYKKKGDKSSTAEEEELSGDPGGRSTPTPQSASGEKGEASSGTNNGPSGDSGGGGDNADTKTNHDKNINDQSFIFEDILKSDSIPGLPGLLTNGMGGDGDAHSGKSRFSKWFSVDESSHNATETRRSSGHDDAMKNLIKDINETNVSIPGDSESYFAPISPAANTGVVNNSKSISIMEMLRRTKHNEATLKSQVPGRILSLEDLEAKMRHNTETPMNKKHSQKSDEDVIAFNRLLQHMTVNHANVTSSSMPGKGGPPMSLMEMLSHSQQQDEARMAQLLGPVSPGAGPHDLASRLSQQQQKQQVEMLTKLMNAGVPVRASPLPEVMLQQQSHELLNRPEAQAILQGLKIGDITPQHLYQQLANPALQPRHREMLTTILKVQGGGSGGGGVGPSPRVLSPVAPSHPLFQQQQLRVSPLPPNAIHQRIPSPRELQVHTQNILQRALIKKKLEEQQENFRRKQELQQRGQSPSSNNNNNIIQQAPQKSVSSPTPLAFTPTSVLRKMTAEKDDKDLSKLGQGRALTGMRSALPQQQAATAAQQQSAIGSQWPPYQMKQAGRPIVKANNFPQQASQEQFFTQQQQQKFLTQLQQQHQQQQQQQQQQRKQFHGYGGPQGGYHQQYANPNQQFSQLRAQHQQHARPTNVSQPGFANQPGNGSWLHNSQPGRDGRNAPSDGELSPTSNQLTRWFSPDLLERARGGELPSTAGLSQQLLSLEEIERLTAPPVHN